jgi:shikimate dehydrogenase
LIADPVIQARSPAAVNALLAERGRLGQFVLVPMHVAAEGLVECVAALRHVHNFAGAIVSMPHKTAIAALVDELTHPARLVGAVNVIARGADGRFSGGLLDGVGFVDGLASAGHRVAGAKCVLAGAGGAASAVAFALADAGCASILITNRTPAKALALAARLQRAFPDVVASAGSRTDERFDIAINGTSLGMNANDELPLPMAVIERRSCRACSRSWGSNDDESETGCPDANKQTLARSRIDLQRDRMRRRAQLLVHVLPPQRRARARGGSDASTSEPGAVVGAG